MSYSLMMAMLVPLKIYRETENCIPIHPIYLPTTPPSPCTCLHRLPCSPGARNKLLLSFLHYCLGGCDGMTSQSFWDLPFSLHVLHFKPVGSLIPMQKLIPSFFKMLPRCNGFPLQPWTAGPSPFRVKLKNALLSPPTSSPLIYLENALIMRLSIPFHRILLVKLGMTLSCQIWLPLCPHLVQLLNTLTGPITSIELSVVPLQVTELPWNLSYFPGCSFFTLSLDFLCPDL